jgi:hypothetical protein
LRALASVLVELPSAEVVADASARPRAPAGSISLAAAVIVVGVEYILGDRGELRGSSCPGKTTASKGTMGELA